jgi:mannosyl-3-phosphoglycerate phosphatase
VELVKARKIPLIFCSAKTRAEQEAYRSELDVTHPFIVEDGSAIFIRKGYFPFSFDYQKEITDYQVIELGRPYWYIRNILFQIAQENNMILKGFGNMTIGEIAKLTGLSEDAAVRAKSREYEETVTTKLSEETQEHIRETLAEYNLQMTDGGRFHGVMDARSNKGRAISILTDLYRRRYNKVYSIGIGDSLNDIPLLKSVDLPLLVQKPGGKWENIHVSNLRRVDGIGPAGWDRAIREVCKAIDGGANED